MFRKIQFYLTAAVLFGLFSQALPGQDLLSALGKHQDYISKRISSYDRTGGNNDRLSIKPGETAILAEIAGPAAIHHIWVTISAEPFYGRKIILRMYWDGEENPSVEVPIGDFFNVGHGLNRNVSSLPITNSSEGRARNCYWYMPFQKSARLTATNEGSREVGAFYYYIDYRELKELPENTPTFHAFYHQETPCLPGQNYLILDALGKGHYVGCNLSILQRAMGWWGEGDDMICIDGETHPSLYGTGSEDYFSDAWGMREDENLFYGCPLQESDFKTGSKATVYRFHIPDPIPFKKSIRVTIEHGHANDRSDYFSSVAYWYQEEPHKTFPPLPPVSKRLPFAKESSGGFLMPEWDRTEKEGAITFTDKISGTQFSGKNITHSLTSFYNQQGKRYPVLKTEKTEAGNLFKLSLFTEIGEQYDLDLYFLKSPYLGKVRAVEIRNREKIEQLESYTFDGYSQEREIEKISLKDIRLYPGKSTLILEAAGKASESQGRDMAFISTAKTPSQRRFISEWHLIGPFDAPDMTYLQTAYPPEKEIDLKKKYEGKESRIAEWKKIKTPHAGFIDPAKYIKPTEQVIVYGLAYVYSPEPISTDMLIGSDDGVRIWFNDNLIHTNPAFRGAYPDQDKIPVTLKKGWNKVLIKVLQGAGGWGFYVRFVDPEGKLKYSTEMN
jgi:hypothetical protein